MRRALLIVLLPVLVLALAGCASSKISPQQAAQQLAENLNPSYHVQCGPTSGSFWDYACTVTPPRASKDKPYKLKVTVGPHEIVDRAYCGARTGTFLNC
jgi:hypothetical protein